MATTIQVQELQKVRTPSMSYARAFMGLFLRDLHVLRRQMGAFLVRVIMNPLLFLFIFTFVMPHMTNGAAMNATSIASR